MQQTDKYKLNKPGVDDPIAIAPLNENMDKVEGALAAEAEARQAGDAALDQRLQVLELHKFAAGSYLGNGTAEQSVELGFKPFAVLIATVGTYNFMRVYCQSQLDLHATASVFPTDSGFFIRTPAPGDLTKSGTRYNYLAFA